LIPIVELIQLFLQLLKSLVLLFYLGLKLLNAQSKISQLILQLALPLDDIFLILYNLSFITLLELFIFFLERRFSFENDFQRLLQPHSIGVALLESFLHLQKSHREVEDLVRLQGLVQEAYVFIPFIQVEG